MKSRVWSTLVKVMRLEGGCNAWYSTFRDKVSFLIPILLC